MTQTMRVLTLWGVLFFASCSTAHGQNLPPIVTARLGFTKAPGVVNAGVVQLEAGYAHSELGDRTRHTVGEGLLRIGLGQQFELRAGIPSYLQTRTPADTISGMGDGLIALRRRFTDAAGWRPMFSVQAGATVPIGADEITAGEVQPELAGYAMWRLPEAFQLLTMGVYRNAVAGDDRYGLSTLSAGLRRDLVPGLTAQADYGYVHSSRDGANDSHHIRASAALRLGPDLQLDTYVGQTTSGGHDETLFGVGISTRWY